MFNPKSHLKKSVCPALTSLKHEIIFYGIKSFIEKHV